LVAICKDDRSAWWFGGGAVIAAVLLFSALEARRQGAEQAETQTAGTSLAAPESVPELVVPAAPAELSPGLGEGGVWHHPSDAKQSDARPLVAPQSRLVSVPSPPPQSNYNEGYQPPHPPQLVNDPGYSPQSQDRPQSPVAAEPATVGAKRIMAGQLENPATTVVQGTLVNAVLETALDSTRPGQTRALVTRDVYGFDGTRLLIPRGTRLYGTYEADVAQGQKRAQIRWTRLLRPDGVSVALDSPAADPLGRAGVAGKVNNHFFQRMGNALIGTTATIGSAVVSRNAGNSPVVLAVPGTAQTVAQPVVQSANQINPTLTVRQGTRITVFVQHDLDFSSVEDER
jgi:type IV secretion system protein VirB10